MSELFSLHILANEGFACPNMICGFLSVSEPGDQRRQFIWAQALRLGIRFEIDSQHRTPALLSLFAYLPVYRTKLLIASGSDESIFKTDRSKKAVISTL
jgi:hypothetical protein